MNIIAHRANLDGPKANKENRISSIEKCIDFGFDVEVDIRLINENLFLGHDDASELITKEQLMKIKNKVWIHCKNLDAISYFNKIDEEFNYFWHENDSYTLTSKGFIWAYPGQELTSNCVCVMPEKKYGKSEFKFLKDIKIAGICTDYPHLFR